MRKEITFDRFIRGLLTFCIILASIYFLRYFKAVLIPFFVAWLLAYMLYPVVTFLQYKCKLRSRILSIFITFALMCGIFFFVGYLIIPPFVDEFDKVKTAALAYFSNPTQQIHSGPIELQKFVREIAKEYRFDQLLQQENIFDVIKQSVPKAWDMLWSTAGKVVSILSSLIAILYFFFILKDYEKYAKGWIYLIPKKHRKQTQKIVSDVIHCMNGYFRGQTLVALSNCIMFSIGFYLIGFPLPFALGSFIGIISFIPYLQILGFLPATLLALLQAASHGDNFWISMSLVALVYIVVQVIQDSIVTPKVMGRIMGLSPAVILLSLTLWGYFIGIIGLIIALPTTTLLLSYYKEFVIAEDKTLK